MQTRPQSQWILLVALTGLALYLCWSIMRPFLPVLLWAAVLVIVFHPAYRWWRHRLGSVALAALVTTLLVIVTIIVPLVAVSSAVVAQLQGVASAAQDQVTGLLADPVQAARLQESLDWLTRYAGIEVAEIRQGLQQAATALSRLLVQETMSVLGGALGFIVSTFFVMFTMYYLFKDGEAAVEVVQSMLPLDRARSDALVQRTGEVVTASVFGVVVIAIVQGTLGGLMFWVLGLPSPLVWGVVMIVLATIPMLGTFLVWVPAAIFLAVTGHLVKALVLTFWGAVVIGMADNMLRPRLVGDRAQMHELLIFFSVLGGLQVFGVLGILLGPVVVAIGLSLLEAFRAADTGVVPVTDAEVPPAVAGAETSANQDTRAAGPAQG
jgi:predicted PurR-regulated permease PerM